MREVVLRPRACADLEDIWLYTDERWGSEQASRYLRQLDERILGLAAAPLTNPAEPALYRISRASVPTSRKQPAA